MNGRRCVFVSDLHLSCDQDIKWKYLIRWLDGLRYPIERLYILGDLFKYWLGDDYQDEMTKQLASAIGKLSQRMEVILLRGNRDYLIGKGFTGNGVQILKDGSVVDLYGHPTMLMHGDRLCSRDWRYRFFRALADNAVSRFVFTSLPISWRDGMAKFVQGTLSHKKDEANVWLDYDWLGRRLASCNAKQVIYGHLHQSCTRLHAKYREICLPSWDTRPAWLEYSSDHSICFKKASFDD